MSKHYLYEAPAWMPDWCMNAINRVWKWTLQRFFPGKVRYYVAEGK